MNGDISAVTIGENTYGIKDAVAREQRTTFKIFDGNPYKADLSVIKLSSDEYEQLVAGGGVLLSDALYIVEGENEDMYGQRVTNVGWPTDLSDAATKLYVDQAVPTDLSAFANSPGYLVPADVNMSYDSTFKKIWLSSGTNVTSVDCSDFIKDGMLSTVKLCSDQLIFVFNTDAGTSPISVALSNFVDETQYYKKTETSSAIEISNALSMKQYNDKYTVVEYVDGTISAFDLSGTLLSSDIPNRESIKFVNIGTNISSIGNYAFYVFNNNKSSLINIVIPNSVVSIGESAFSNNTCIKQIFIPASVSSIGNAAFTYTSLTSIIIEDGSNTLSVGALGFFHNLNLKKVVIPKRMTYMNYQAFSDDANLEQVIFKDRSIVEVQAMTHYPWDIPSNRISSITTWNDASQEWVLEQLSDVGSDFKTETISATNSIWEVQPNTRAIFNANVSNGDTIILKDYSVDNKYQLVLSSTPSTSCQVQLLVEDNNAAYAHATISPAFKILSPGQRYDATIWHDSFTFDDDNQQYAVRSIVPLSVGGYGYATTEYNAYLVDNSINNINLDAALTSTPVCNLQLPAPQVVNNDAKARAFYASTNISASLQLPEFDVVGNALTYRYGDGKPLTALEANQPYYFVETKTNEFSIWKFGAGSGSGGEAQEKYQIVTLSGELSSGVLHYYVEDCTIATIEISSSVTPVAIHLPPKPEEHVARDFILRVEISSSIAPTVTFSGVDEQLQYDSDDSDWAVLEPGLNFISFTETK